MLISNNTQVEDWLLLGKALRGDFSGKTLEMKFVLKSAQAMQTFIQNKAGLKKTVQDIRKDLRYSRILSRFYFGDFSPSVALQKSLVDAQAGIFDDVAVQLIEDKFDEFKEVYEYASNTKSFSISPIVDVATDAVLLAQIIPYLVGANPKSMRWKYRKITTYPENYRIISRGLTETKIESYVVGCRKRCGIKYRDCENLCTTLILRAAFGFTGGCFDYQHPIRDKDGKKFRFPRDGMDKFSANSYEWEKVRHVKTFRVSRMADFNAIDGADISSSAINSRAKLKLLLNHVQTI